MESFAVKLVISLLILMIIEFIIYRLFVFRNLNYSRELSENAVFEGEEVFLYEKIENKKILPIGWLSADIGLSENLEILPRPGIYVRYNKYCRSVFSLLPYTSVTRKNIIRCKKRGEYSLNTVSITTSDLLGLSGEMSKQYSIDAPLVVYPVPADKSMINLPSHNWMGDLIVRRFIMEDPFFIAGTRPYQYGDPLNRISWKATARTDSLQTYKYDHSTHSDMLIWFNAEVDPLSQMSSDDVSQKIIDFGISCCATFAETAIDNGVRVGFDSNAFSSKGGNINCIEPLNGTAQFYTILTELARVEYGFYHSFYRFIEDKLKDSVTGKDILLVSAFMDERLLQQAQLLREKGNFVEIFNIGLEHFYKK